MSNFLSIKSASDLLGVSTKTLRRWEKEGKITPTRTEGGHRRYDISTLLKNKSDSFFKLLLMQEFLVMTKKRT